MRPQLTMFIKIRRVSTYSTHLSRNGSGGLSRPPSRAQGNFFAARPSATRITPTSNYKDNKHAKLRNLLPSKRQIDPYFLPSSFPPTPGNSEKDEFLPTLFLRFHPLSGHHKVCCRTHRHYWTQSMFRYIILAKKPP